ncbi:MAG: hypothetical protein QOI11_3446 [Candidatus Eremiobacteraeota bacterium]|jgi:hypothetical protein|nr:hypothetical protein [Candidatus Eremiobacteraeota bacterium]
MPELRFDDIDLREEPASSAREQDTIYSNPPAMLDPAPTTTRACCV